MSEIILQASGISKAFGGVQALKKVDLSIRAGEVHCLAGGNGSGKSTLIKIISGFYRPDEGRITLGGKTYERITPIEAINQGVQVIYQDLSVFPNLTVAENIAITHEVSQGKKLVSWRKVRQIAETAMKKIGVQIPLKERVEDLSVADKQIIAIARAIFQNARLIIMDEPTTALTRKEIDKLFSIIHTLQKEGIAVLFVSHKLDEVFEIAENFTIFRNGENVVTDSTKNVDNDKFIYYMTGRKLEGDLFDPQDIRRDTPLFRVENLGVRNGFEDISFSVYPGEILGITGLLGSGRTELAKSLFGIYPAETGTIYIDEQPVAIRSPQDAIRNKIGYVPEDRLTEGLFLQHSTRQNMAVAHIDQLVKKNGTIDNRRIDEDVDFWKEELSIKLHHTKDAIATLSGGNQQKVVLGKWLEIQPKVLILNGPTVGVDIGAKHDLHAYLRGLAAAHSIAIIIISDDISEVHQNCNRILIMKQGRITGEFKNTQTSEQELSCQVTTQA